MGDIRAVQPVDLDAIEAAVSKMRPAPWHVDHDGNGQANIYGRTNDHWIALLPHQCLASIEQEMNSDAEGIVSLRNAASSLVAELRSVRALLAERVQLNEALTAANKIGHGLSCMRLDDDDPYDDRYDCGGDCGYLAAHGICEEIERVERELAKHAEAPNV